MKHVAMLLTVSSLLLAACAQEEESWTAAVQNPTARATHQVSFALTRTTVEEFTAAGITEVGIYAYLNDSLVYGQNLAINDGSLQVELPLGETISTFAVANAGSMTDADSLSTVCVRMDEAMSKEIFLSEVVTFASDNSVGNLSLELKRLVGQAILQPKETAEQLATVTQFDRLDVTFANVGVGYYVASGSSLQESRTVSATHADGFVASLYGLPTAGAPAKTSITLSYLNGETEVNSTFGSIDTGLVFEPSKRSTVYVPILNEAYLNNPWSAVATTRSGMAREMMPFTLVETNF
ncbi:MAG: hypothetical protein LBN29_12570 [Mediterranea sp.]|jgi:hypothetical protein|nr:hypothetical protein [Mediterranea sp.]